MIYPVKNFRNSGQFVKFVLRVGREATGTINVVDWVVNHNGTCTPQRLLCALRWPRLFGCHQM